MHVVRTRTGMLMLLLDVGTLRKWAVLPSFRKKLTLSITRAEIRNVSLKHRQHNPLPQDANSQKQNNASNESPLTPNRLYIGILRPK